MQPAVLIAPRDRTAAGAYFDDIDDGQLHRLTGEGVTDDVAFLDRRDTIGDQRRLRRGAAHVEADGAFDADNLRDTPGADHAGDRAGFHHRDRRATRLAGRHGAAVRAHDGDLPGKAGLIRELLQPAQIAADARSDESVEHGRRSAFIFAKLAQDFMAQRDEYAG